MTLLFRLSLRTAFQRLKKNSTYTVFALISLTLAGVLCSLSAAWLLEVATLQLPYRSAQNLWFLQFQNSSFSTQAYGPEMQASSTLVKRFAAQQTAFDSITVAKAEQLRIGQVSKQQIADKASVLMIDDQYWTVLGVQPRYGRVTQPYKKEVVLTYEWAHDKFGSVKNALASTVQIAGDPYAVAGVMAKDFLLPILLSRQHDSDTKPVIFMPKPLLTTAQEENIARQMLVIGRSATSGELLKAATNKFIATFDARWAQGASATVQPLRAHMAGKSVQLAALLFGAAVLLAFTALAGLGMLAAGRFLARGPNHYVFTALGASTAQETIFEKMEVAVVLVIAFGIALLLLSLGIGVFASLSVMPGVFNLSLLLFSIGFLLAYFLIAAVILLFAVAGSMRKTRNKNGAGHNTGSGSRSAPQLFFYRVLLAIQTLISLAVLSAVFAVLEQSWHATQTAFASDFDNLTAWQIEFSDLTPGAQMATELARVKRAALALNGVKDAVIVLASPLDLLGSAVAYRGPRMIDGTVVSRKNGTTIFQSTTPRSKQQGPTQIDYKVSVVAAEPEFLSMMGYQLIAGKLFANAQENTVLLTPEAREALFEDYSTVIGERAPGLPKETRADIWHNALRVSGVVDAGRVAAAGALGSWISNIPVVFVPYRPFALSSNDTLHKATVLIQHQDQQVATSAVLAAVLSDSSLSGIRGTSLALQDEVQRRLVRHFVSSLGTLLIGLMVLLSAWAGALGSMHFSCQKRLSEIGIRLALGAKERQIVMLFSRQELLLPAILALLWLLLCAASVLLFSVVGRISPVSVLDGVLAVVIVLCGLLLGFLLGLIGPLRQPPMEALRSE